VTQGADDADEGEPSKGSVTRESREAGRFGEKGWTEAAGMPFWESRAKADESSGPSHPGDAEAAKTKKKKAKDGSRGS
jgi:hypothetical protein